MSQAPWAGTPYQSWEGSDVSSLDHDAIPGGFQPPAMFVQPQSDAGMSQPQPTPDATPTPHAPFPVPPPMPPMADADLMRELFTAVVNNNRTAQQHTEALAQLEAQIRDTNANATHTANIAAAAVNATQSAVPTASASSVNTPGYRPPTVKVREPQYFTGKADHVEKFIREVQTNVNLQRAAFPRDADKVDYMSMYLGTGTPQSWFNAVQRTKPHLLISWEAFKTEFIQRFQTSDLIGKYTRRIEALSQKGSAADFANQYVECLAYIDWSEQVKINQFTRRLKPDLRKLIVNVKRPATLDEWIPIVIEADNNLHELEIELKRDEKRFKSNNSSQHPNGPRPRYDPPTPPAPSSTGSNDPTPMEVDATRQGPRGPLTPEEKELCRRYKLCFYCGAGSHQFKDCPNRHNSKSPPSTGKA